MLDRTMSDGQAKRSMKPRRAARAEILARTSNAFNVARGRKSKSQRGKKKNGDLIFFWSDSVAKQREEKEEEKEAKKG